jgi:hypothetical protein
MKYTLIGVPRIVNWMLAAALASSAVASFFQYRDGVGLAVFIGLLSILLLIGVLLRSPMAYLGIATLSFLGIATALNRAEIVLAALNAAAMTSALFVRGRLHMKASDSSIVHGSHDE